jgi:BirA family transcriptional regulator, biotin operon repressor / biotin---[acetyl-CoA-carboxylase] ligase
MIDFETILNGLHEPGLPRSIRWYAQLASTMDTCREALAGLHDHELPLLIGAEEQLAGRGRRGRSWLAPTGTALLFSLALRPQQLAAEQGVALIWAASVALCEGIAATTGLEARLKWPNDLLLWYGTKPQWHKIAGVLLETSSDQYGLRWAILGCGINISANPPPSAVRYPAGNLVAAYGQPIHRPSLLRAILLRYAYWFTQLEHGKTEQLFAAWRGLLQTVGTQVAISTDNTTSMNGYAEGVDHSGALLVRDNTGRLHTITNGDVGLIHEKGP